MRAFFALVPMALFAGCSVAAAPDTTLATRNFTVGAFDAVSLKGSDNVKVVTGAIAGVVASGPANVLDKLDIRVEGSKLIIGRKTENWSVGWREERGATITVTTPGIKSAAIAGSGDMTVDRVAGDAFDASIAGSGDMNLSDVKVKTADFSISGSGNLRAGGTADAASLSIAGSGDMLTQSLVSQTADVSIAGSGDASITARSKAEISIVGSGDAVVKGTTDCAISKVGSGDARCDP